MKEERVLVDPCHFGDRPCHLCKMMQVEMLAELLRVFDIQSLPTKTSTDFIASCAAFRLCADVGLLDKDNGSSNIQICCRFRR